MKLSSLFLTIFYALTFYIPVSARLVYNIQNYSSRDGLPSNFISCAEQDSNGLMWFGTWNGLCCFDGYNFIDFRGNSAPVSSRLHLLRKTDDNNMWCLTYDRRIFFFNTRNCLYTDVSAILKNISGKSHRIRNIYVLNNGVTWFTCYDGDRCLWRLECQNEADFPANVHIQELYDEICTDSDVCHEVVNDSNNGEWVVTDHRNIEYKSHATSTGKIPGSLPNKYRTPHFSQPPIFTDEMNQSKPFAVKKIIYQDAQGNLWDNGRHHLTRITACKRHFSLSPISPELDIRSVMMYDNDHYLAGLDNGELQLINTTDNSRLYLCGNGQFSKNRTAMSTRIYSLRRDHKGRLWIGTKGDGLYMLDAKGVMHHFIHDPADEYSLQGNDVFDIYQDSRHTIYVGCYDGGFNIVNESEAGDKISFINSDNRLQSFPKEQFAKIRHITESGDGLITLSTADGILTFSNRSKLPTEVTTYGSNNDYEKILPGGNVMQTLLTSKGRVFVSSMTGGLLEQMKDSHQFIPVKSTMNRPGIVLSMIEDRKGFLWLARENVLERFNPETGECTIFADSDFGTSLTFSEAKPAIDSIRGNIIMGLQGGVLIFDPDKMVKNDYTPHILFSAVQYQGEQQRHPIIYTDLLDVPSDKRNLTIFFAALDYRGNALIRYAYKIEGKDNDWTYVGDSHSASFNNLPCGDLRLLVRSTNADGVWCDNVSALNIYSHPVFAETLWAKLLWVLSMCMIVYAAVWIVKIRQRQRQEYEAMERKVKKLIKQIAEYSAVNQQSAESGQGSSLYYLDEPKIDDEDKQMMARLMEYLEKNICNSELKMQDLAEAVGMSRTIFNEKLKQLSGMYPLDFVRYLRLQRAQQLISNSSLTLSQIAYEVGFSDPNYFSKSFKKSTGMSPSDYRKSHPRL